MVYKIRIILDTREDIFRDIEIKGKQTLWNLHLGIKSAFSLQGEELSNFNLLESDGTVYKSVALEDMSDLGDGEIMSDVYITEVFEASGDKVQFQYGLLDLWEFFAELIEIVPEKPSVNYPITVFRFGNVPIKAPGKQSAAKSKTPRPPMGEDEFDFGDEFSDSEYDSDDLEFEDEEQDDFSQDPYEDDLD